MSMLIKMLFAVGLMSSISLAAPPPGPLVLRARLMDTKEVGPATAPSSGKPIATPEQTSAKTVTEIRFFVFPDQPFFAESVSPGQSLIVQGTLKARQPDAYRVSVSISRDFTNENGSGKTQIQTTTLEFGLNEELSVGGLVGQGTWLVSLSPQKPDEPK